MCVIVFDLEMNQPSNNIIQISAVFVDLKQKRILKEFDSLCNPGELPCERISELTGITKEQVEVAPSFVDIAVSFWDWVEACKCGNRLWAWGNDYSLLKSKSQSAGIKVHPKVLDFNIQPLSAFVRSAKGAKQKGGLSTSLELLGLSFEGTPHNALHDSRNTAFYLFEVFSLLKHVFDIKEMLQIQK